MAIAAHNISVIIKYEAVLDNYPNGWSSFRKTVDKASCVTDREIISVQFDNPMEVKSFVNTLMQFGLTWEHENTAIDFVIVDEKSGPTSDCTWIEVEEVDLDNGDIQLAIIKKNSKSEHLLYTQRHLTFEKEDT